MESIQAAIVELRFGGAQLAGIHQPAAQRFVALGQLPNRAGMIGHLGEEFLVDLNRPPERLHRLLVQAKLLANPADEQGRPTGLKRQRRIIALFVDE